MKIIILNSGLGSRLGNLTKNLPKSLVNINNDETIFSRAINILSNYSKDFIITTGYLNNVLIKYSKNNYSNLNFTFVHNSVYDKTNYIKSLDLIDEINEDIILLHGDLVFSSDVAEKIIYAKESSVVIDSSIDLPKDDFKAKIVDNKVNYISTKYFGDDAVACQPFYKLKKNDWKEWKNKIHEFCQQGKTDVYAENALNTILNQITIRPLDIMGDLCTEIDDQNDLKRVKELLK
ncbi:phosphocholine cytidylyltransferase family protein [Methanobrevibacter millerae]|uniref:Choline kinase n=1 Tax=Methanobrevibacter millerae TaxID=230361 RepID=A0A1G5WV01_9EURY|nr:sugar phosphate nucleotidyltransferase [Methanobrevibacter millerae]SDA61780.1 Choline kinase [Methanobrevibacter millerae]